MKKIVKYSVVIPLCNEQGNILILDEQIKKTMNEISDIHSYEIIYVNDGSKDKTLEELKKLKKIKIINLNRNYGQATALDAGFKQSKGEIVISLDGDLQNDPKDIPRLLEKLKKEDLDVVCGWRKHRKDKNGIRILTRIGRVLRRFLIKDPVHDTGCTLRVYKKNAVKSLDLQGEMHRYILSLLRWKGFKIGEIEVNHRPRYRGKTKYGYIKALRGFIDLINVWFLQKYSQRPAHMFGSLGLFSFFFGFGITLWSILRKILGNIDLSENGWFIVGLFFMGISIFLFSMGFLLNMLIRIKFDVSKFEKRYYIREIIKK